MIAVLTDSTCDLPPEILQKLGIHMLPLWVNCGGHLQRDWEDIAPQQVFEALVSGGTRVSTGPVTVQQFRDMYAQKLRQYSGVVSLHISSGISDTVAHAQQAARLLGADAERIRIIDTGVSSVLLASAVLRARKAAQQNLSLNAVEQAVQQTLRQQYGEFTVPSLEYLRRSGRISPVQYVAGNLLGVRPIIAFREGKLEPVRRAKPQLAAGDMLQVLEERFGTRPLSVAIGLAGSDAQRLAELRQQMRASGLNIRVGRTQQIGAVIGAHTGPGLFAFVAEPYYG